MTLSELTATDRRLALVGLAKNTGKTVALTTLLGELAADGRCVGVTSVGRDGEEHDVIDARIDKPRVRLAPGSIVATTDGLLRASTVPYELLQDTEIRTPLGRVLIARLSAAGTIEIAGPSAAADIRAVSDAMLANGAEQMLIDGAVDRRAASSPDVADGLVISTGAVLSHDISEVVLQTKDAVDLARLPNIDDDAPDSALRLRELARSSVTHTTNNAGPTSVLVGEDLEPVALPPRFVLSSDAEQIAQLLDANPTPAGCSLPARCRTGSCAALCIRSTAGDASSRWSWPTRRRCSSGNGDRSGIGVRAFTYGPCIASSCRRSRSIPWHLSLTASTPHSCERS